MFSRHELLWAIVIPGGIGLLLTLVGIFLKSRAWICALAMGIAFVAAFPALKAGHWQMPSIPPAESSGWLPWIAALATALAIVGALGRVPTGLRMLLVAIVAGIGLTLLLKFKFRATWTVPAGASIIAGFAVLAAVWYAAIEVSANQAKVITPMMIWLIGCCMTVVSMMVGIDSYGKSALAMVVASMATFPMMLGRNSAGASRGVAIVFSILIVTMLAGEHFLGSLRAALVAILGSAPIFIWLGRFVPKRLKSWQRGVVRAALAMIPLGAAVAIAAVQFHHDQMQDESGYNY